MDTAPGRPPDGVAERPRPEDAVRRFVVAVCGVGVVTVAASALLAGEVPTAAAVLLTAAAIALGDLPVVHVRHGEQNHSFTWSEAAMVAGLVLLPAWWLPIVGVVVVALEQAVLRRPPVKLAFNSMAFGVAAFLATAALQLGRSTFDTSGDWAALAAACTVYFVTNWLSVAVVVARSQRSPVAEIARSGLLLGTLFALANSSVAVLVAIAAPREPLVLLAVPPVLAQLMFVHRNTREVIGERDLWVAVQGASEHLQRASSGELPRVALDAVTQLVGADAAELVTVTGAAAVRHRRDSSGTEATTGSVTRLADDVWGRADCDRSPFWLDRAGATTRQQRWMARAGVRSVLVIPLEWGSEMVGILRVGFAARPASTERIESLLLTMATQVASTITSHRQTESLRHQAEHDELTDLPNRHHLVQHLTGLLERRAEGGAALAVLFLDLDGFKVVNDSLGHHVGDRILLEAADRLRSRMRPGDVVARFGGDEFIVVCPGLHSPEEAMDIAQRLLEALATPATGAPGVPISASVGVAYADGSTDADALLRDADAAMYQAKRTGAGSSCLFTAELRTQVLNRMHLEADLRDALRDEQLEVHYQPIVDLATGEVTELEALARWHHPERGAVSPAAFISVAEESGHIRALGAFVLEQACADMRRWMDLGVARPGQRVAVNLSPMQLDAGLPAVVAEALARHGLPPSALTLEVTESAFVDDADGVGSLERLRAIGVRVSLDDFGTGYSSLSTLRDLPADAVKIDRSFIERVADDGQVAALVRGIVDLAHALELEVIGEGVETSTQSETLQSFGCDHAQGWLHGRPVGAAMVEAMLADGSAQPAAATAGGGHERTLRLA